MDGAKIICPKCHAEMRRGFVPKFPIYEWVGNYWYEVQFEGTRRRALSAKTRRVIYTYRCVSCGYLERYAS
jgi:hypothetical protein